MAQDTIHNGGSRRGVIIAVIALAVFVLGIAMLGYGSKPEGITPAATATN